MACRRALIVALATVFLLAGTAAGDPGSDKAEVDARLGEARANAERVAGAETVLTGELSRLSADARGVAAAVATEEARLASLEAMLAAEQGRLASLEQQVTEQTARLAVLEQQYGVALKVLERRVRAIYESDSPDLISFAFGATSFTDLVDHFDLLDRIGRQDERVASALDDARIAVDRTRAATERARQGVARSVSVIATSTEAQRATRDRIAAQRDALAAVEGAKKQALSGVQEDRAAFIAEVESLAAQSAELAARIAAAQSAASASAVPPTSSSGATLSWPVSGPVTSGFGPRWGRMHEGIDIAVATGTPVNAAAAGTVIYVGWLGGYGNLVVIDHGNGLSTAYAHNSSLAVGEGSAVGAGATIAFSGNTGNSSGPHVHFEVRVHGAAVDPLGYL